MILTFGVNVFDTTTILKMTLLILTSLMMTIVIKLSTGAFDIN